jgi:dihydroorotase-like cyclic amidohydrolase
MIIMNAVYLNKECKLSQGHLLVQNGKIVAVDEDELNHQYKKIYYKIYGDYHLS